MVLVSTGSFSQVSAFGSSIEVERVCKWVEPITHSNMMKHHLRSVRSVRQDTLKTTKSELEMVGGQPHSVNDRSIQSKMVNPRVQPMAWLHGWSFNSIQHSPVNSSHDKLAQKHLPSALPCAAYAPAQEVRASCHHRHILTCVP